MFKSQGVDGRYYLNKILKRKNNNLHCTVDKTIISEDDEQNMIDIKVLIDSDKVSNNEGYILQVTDSSPHIAITIKTYSGYVYAL